MAEDKFAPKSTDTLKEIHGKHVQLIKEQQAVNKKQREDSHKPKAVPANEHKGDKEAPPTQPPASESPANPTAPQLQPENDSHETVAAQPE